MLSNVQHLILCLTYFILVYVAAVKPPPLPVTLSLQQVEIKYKKKYRNQEQKTYRRSILEQNKKLINDHNKKVDRKYELNQNMFIDLSPDEFVRAYTGLMPSTPSIRQYVRDTDEMKAYENDNCNCTFGYEIKKMDIQRKISRNKIQYNKNIDKYLNKLKTVDTSLPYSVIAKNKPATTTTAPTSISKAALVGEALITNQTTDPAATITTITSTVTFPTNDSDIDWTDLAGPIRFQGVCGACFAFTTVQVVQAANAIYLFGGVYIQLSVQQVLDCGTPIQNGCDGGLLQWSYSMMKNNGITANFRYPYISGTTGTVNPCKTRVGQFKIVSYRQLNGTCADLRQQLLAKPVSTTIKSKNMQFYSSGVYLGCLQTDPFDHAVVIIGYNASVGWKFKNTWGSSWGMQGYGWLSLDERKNCGICATPVAPKTYNEP